MGIDDMFSVLEVARHGSISAAAKKLGIAQPNLSRTIRCLEDEYGITIFTRVHKGVIPTKEGTLFLQRIGRIVEEEKALREAFTSPSIRLSSISLSVPRASYISESFSEYLSGIPSDTIGIMHYDECSSEKAIQNLRERQYGLAVIRYAIEDEDYYMALARLERLSFERLSEFTYRLLISERSPLAEAPSITREILDGYIEILHGDEVVPGAGWVQDVALGKNSEKLGRKIFITERGSQFDMLSSITDSYMWVSPMPRRFLNELHLVERDVESPRRVMRDALMYGGRHTLTREESDFLKILRANIFSADFDEAF